MHYWARKRTLTFFETIITISFSLYKNYIYYTKMCLIVEHNERFKLKKAIKIKVSLSGSFYSAAHFLGKNKLASPEVSPLKRGLILKLKIMPNCFHNIQIFHKTSATVINEVSSHYRKWQGIYKLPFLLKKD